MNTFRLIVSSPEGELFNGQAEALFVRGSDASKRDADYTDSTNKNIS